MQDSRYVRGSLRVSQADPVSRGLPTGGALALGELHSHRLVIQNMKAFVDDAISRPDDAPIPDGTVEVLHAAPRKQLARVHDVTQRLFSAYTIHAGHVHLAGCELIDRMILRLVYRRHDAPGGNSAQANVVFVAESGDPITPELVQSLGLTETELVSQYPQVSDEAIERLLHSATRLALASETRTSSDREAKQAGSTPVDDVAQGEAASSDEQGIERLEATVIWCKYTEGKLRFTIGGKSLDVPVSGWASNLKPPPILCPQTGRETYQLAATSDGLIAAADEIGTCSKTEQRVLASELFTCDVSGERMQAEFILRCPVTGDTVAQTLAETCPTCAQQVSPHAFQAGECLACRGRKSVTKADPRIARVLGEYPKLDQWRSWRIAETITCYNLTAGSLLRRLLLVLDKQTLEVRALATGGRFAAGWTYVVPEQFGEFLG